MTPRSIRSMYPMGMTERERGALAFFLCNQPGGGRGAGTVHALPCQGRRVF